MPSDKAFISVSPTATSAIGNYQYVPWLQGIVPNEGIAPAAGNYILLHNSFQAFFN